MLARYWVRVNAIPCVVKQIHKSTHSRKNVCTGIDICAAQRHATHMQRNQKTKRSHKTVTLTPEAVEALNAYCQKNILKRHIWLSKLILETVKGKHRQQEAA